MREFESWSKQPSRTRKAAIRRFGDNTIGAIGHGAATYDARHHHYSVKEHIAKTRAAAGRAAEASSGRSRGGGHRLGGEGGGDNANLHGSDSGHIIVPKRYDSEDGAPPAENFIEDLMNEDSEGDEYGDEFVTADPEAVQSHIPDVLEPFTTEQNPLKLQEWTDKFQDQKKEKDGPLHLHSTAGLLAPFEDNTLQVRRVCQVCEYSQMGPVQVTSVCISAYTCIEMQGNTPADADILEAQLAPLRGKQAHGPPRSVPASFKVPGNKTPIPARLGAVGETSRPALQVSHGGAHSGRKQTCFRRFV